MFWIGLLIGLLSAQTGEGPSFSCAHVTGRVNQLICATPGLAALDRELATVFGNMRGQAAIDQKQLRADENAWLAAMGRECLDAACVQGRYEARLSALREQSLRAASPAAYEETRPFPAPAALWAEARGLVGKRCSFQAGTLGPVIPGFAAAARFLPVILSGGVTVVREKGGVRFAFLASVADGGACEIRDVVVLPATAVGDRFLQCSVWEPKLNGFGVRDVKTHGLEGFWAVDDEGHKLERVAMGVLGIEKKVRCQQPEGGE